MGIWVVYYKMRNEKFQRVYEIPKKEFSDWKNEGMRFLSKCAMTAFRQKFQQEIDDGEITNIKLAYSFSYDEYSPHEFATPKESPKTTSSDALF